MKSWVRWGSVLVAAVMVAVAGTAYGRKPVATAESIVVALPRQGAQVGSDILDIITARYLAFLASPVTLRQVAESEGIPLDTVEESEVARAPGTINIVVRAKAPTADLAEQIANALASAAVAFSGSDDLVRVQVVAPAVIAS